MKKLLFIAFAIFGLIGCEGPEGPMGPQGPRGHDGVDGEGPNWYKNTVIVHEADWKLKGNPGELNSYYYFYKPLSGLNKVMYDSGSIVVYIELEEGIKNGMPYVLHLGEESGGKEFLWTQTYDFDFDEEGVGFYVTYSDFNTQIPPGTETFHVVILW